VVEGGRRLDRFAYVRSCLARDDKRLVDPIGLPLRPVSVAPEEVPLVFHDVGPDDWGKGVLEVMALESLAEGTLVAERLGFFAAPLRYQAQGGVGAGDLRLIEIEIAELP